MSRDLREEVFGEVLAHDNDCRGNGFSGRVEARKETTDRLLPIIAREVEAALTAAALRARASKETEA